MNKAPAIILCIVLFIIYYSVLFKVVIGLLVCAAVLRLDCIVLILVALSTVLLPSRTTS